MVENLRGCEDQCVILLDCALTLETVSRARNNLIMLTKMADDQDQLSEALSLGLIQRFCCNM